MPDSIGCTRSRPAKVRVFEEFISTLGFRWSAGRRPRTAAFPSSSSRFPASRGRSRSRPHAAHHAEARYDPANWAISAWRPMPTRTSRDHPHAIRNWVDCTARCASPPCVTDERQSVTVRRLPENSRGTPPSASAARPTRSTRARAAWKKVRFMADKVGDESRATSRASAPLRHRTRADRALRRGHGDTSRRWPTILPLRGARAVAAGGKNQGASTGSAIASRSRSFASTSSAARSI